MPVYLLEPKNLWFPSPDLFDGDVIAVGGDLTIERMLEAYTRGIFPWYNDPGEFVWWCPERRCVLNVDEVKISHSMRNVFNKGEFECRFDTSFREVLEGCRSGTRAGETWLHDEVVDVYMELFRLGLAHSVETWRDGKLVGGLYGLCLGRMFFGESMFSFESNASKFALISLAKSLEKHGFKYIDCQVYTDHLGSLGAYTMTRELFLQRLHEELQFPTLQGNWTTLKVGKND